MDKRDPASNEQHERPWWLKPPEESEELQPASGRPPMGPLVRRVPRSYKGRTMGGIRAVGRVSEIWR